MAKSTSDFLKNNIFSIITLLLMAAGLFTSFKITEYQTNENKQGQEKIINTLENHEKEESISAVKAEHRFTKLEEKVDTVNQKLDVLTGIKTAMDTSKGYALGKQYAKAVKE